MNTKKYLTGFKALLVVAMSLLLLIPVSMLTNLVRERQSRAREARSEIIQGVGGELLLTGPVLGIPVTSVNKDRIEQNLALVLPDVLSIDADARTEERARGIYAAPVFESAVKIEARFRVSAAECERLFVGSSTANLARAQLFLELPDPRALREPLMATLGDGRVLKLVSAAGAYQADGSLMGSTFSYNGEELIVKMSLVVSGGGALRFVPVGNENSFSIAADWPSPSFTGAILPARRDLREDGFTAQWSQVSGSRRWPKVFDADRSVLRGAERESPGVELYNSVNVYHKSERSLKYALLFIVIPFIVLFLFEVFSGCQLHPVQYALIGFADVLFYALLLSLGEHIPFALAYWAAALAVMLTISLYAGASLRSLGRGFALLPVLGLLYLYLYFALKSEDYALLIGSIGLFALVAGVMYLTRRVNWYDLRPRSPGIVEQDDADPLPDSLPPS